MDIKHYEELLPYCRTNRQKETIQAVINYRSVNIAIKEIGMRGVVFNRMVSRIESYTGLPSSEPQEPTFKGTKQHPRHRRGVLEGSCFIFSSAQNNTLLNDAVMDTLEVMAKSKNAQLIMGGFTYDKRGFQKSEKDESVNWDQRVIKYIVNEQMEVCPGLVWCGELNVLPTATYPAGQFKSYCGNDSIIMPHAKAQLEVVPTEPDRPAKHVISTGAVTQLNYIQKAAGQKAEWDHIFGAVIVEIDDDGDWHARDLNFESESGRVYDLGVMYDKDGPHKIKNSVDVFSLPDVHIDKVEVSQLRPYLHLMMEMNPRVITVNDVHDQNRRNHHNVGDIYNSFSKWVTGKESVRDEVWNSVKFIKGIARLAREEVVIIEANHDLALEKWLKEQDYRKDPVNAEFFLELQLLNYRAIRENPNGKLETFRRACEIVNGGPIPKAKFLKTNEVYRVNGVVHSQHGHYGPGGSRGNTRGYARLGEKYTKGHDHIGGRINGVYSNGVIMTADQSGYVRGQDGWSGLLTLQYINGKRQMICVKNGKYKR